MEYCAWIQNHTDIVSQGHDILTIKLINILDN